MEVFRMLSDEDKQWLSNVVRAVGEKVERLDEKVERNTTALVEGMEHQRVALLEQMEHQRTALLEQMEHQRTALLEQMEQQRIGILERVERAETTLLAEFHKWASPFELRVHSHSAVLRALDAEMEALRERVKKLEEPPAA